jgi:hypothetical protein
MYASRLTSRNGIGDKRTARTTETIVVDAAIPTASVTMLNAVYAGVRLNDRTAILMSAASDNREPVVRVGMQRTA